MKKGVKKELNTLSKDKKHKLSGDDVINLNASNEDLKDFNYANMDNLKIDSEDEDGAVSCWKAGQNEIDNLLSMDVNSLGSNHSNKIAEALINATSTNPLDMFAFNEDDQRYAETKQNEFNEDLDGCIDHSQWEDLCSIASLIVAFKFQQMAENC